MTWLSFSAIILVVGAVIAAARVQIGKRKARDEYRFASACTIEHEPIVAEFRRGGAL